MTACLLTAAAAFSSCSSDDVIDNGGGIVIDETAQTITLAVANAGDNFLATRAARSLYSSAAQQNINKVKVVIYQLKTPLQDGVTTNADLTQAVLDTIPLYGSNKTIVAQKVFSPWMNNGVSNVYSASDTGNGRLASWTLSADDQILEEGVYMAYAVGYNDSEYAAITSFDGAAKSSTFNFPLSIAQNTTTSRVYEVFAGCTPFVVTKKQVKDSDPATYTYHFNVSLTLHRQVAGTIGYFTNIPVKGNADHETQTGAKLRLVASGKSSNVVFAGFNSTYKGGAGVPATDDTTVKYVVNGYNSSSAPAYDAKFYGTTGENDAYTVYEVTLSDWFTDTDATNGMDTDGDGMLNASDTWKNPLDATNANPGVKEGCVLGSSFLFPFAMIADKPTLQLQMLDASGDIIRYWSIRLQNSSSSTDTQIGKTATLVKSDGTTPSNTDTENFANYSILRNHLYSIGLRNAGDGGTDDGGDDKATPLNDQTLILRVNDNWEMIHSMDID